MDKPATQIITTALTYEHDIVLTRQRARQIAGLLGFGAQDQTRIATAVSEIARNAFEYAGGGTAEFRITADGAALQVLISDRGPGFGDLESVMNGTYKSTTGMGVGITGARRLMDHLAIAPREGGGSVVLLEKRTPPRPVASVQAEAARLAEELSRVSPAGPMEEMQQQNHELLEALADLRARQEELVRLNTELEETNRGVVALYAELDERADILRRTNEVKSTFLSNMTHEFRTPLNSILSLSRMLLGDPDEPLSPEQEKQVTYILKQAQNLSDMVNDLLDMAKVEAGKVVIRPSLFSVSSLFATLRGMLRPLLVSAHVNLVFESQEEEIYLDTDEGKVSQILRNFISNALKFTEAGEVRVRATAAPGDIVAFSVEDTGVGIAPGDLDRIFEEYVQVSNPMQNRVPGTGLGLPLAKRLAEMLGGSVSVRSEMGQGSTFTATLPARYAGDREVLFAPEIVREIDPNRRPVLFVEDNRETLYVYEKFLKGSEFQPMAARTVREARQVLKQVRPLAIIMDVMLQDENTWTLLTEVKKSPATREIPTYVATLVENRKQALALGADGYCEKPVSRDWLMETLEAAAAASRHETLLIVDDDEVCRYLLRGLLSGTPFSIAEAGTGEEGILMARSQKPRAIFLDLMMPGMSGYDMLEKLKSDPLTREIPVIVNTARVLSAAERETLVAGADAILSKSSASKADAEAGVRLALRKAGVLPPDRGE
jgi:signal transduction histidine kinase/CheY-like chemotaxis protein